MAKKFKNCEIVQQIDYLENKDMTHIWEVLSHLESTGIKDYAIIIHDKDTNDKGELKAKHFHLALRLKNSYSAEAISKWFNVPSNCVNSVKGKWSDMLKYLTHANAPEKFQYAEASVTSNFDWTAVRDSGSKEDRRREIISKIVNGEIKEYNYGEYIKDHEYDTYRRSIENAFKYRADKIRGVDRMMECIFINGDSGTGKTTYAKLYAKQLGMATFVSSGSNDPLDGYKGEECLILDEFRPSIMSLSDLLKLLDNNTGSTVKSRYRNKVLECKLVILTTVLDMDTFFKNVFSEEKETIVQFKRRCQTKIYMTKEDMTTWFYDDELKDYDADCVCIPNPVSLMIKKNKLTKEEKLRKAKQLCLGQAQLIDIVSKKMEKEENVNTDKDFTETNEQISFNE